MRAAGREIALSPFRRACFRAVAAMVDEQGARRCSAVAVRAGDRGRGSGHGGSERDRLRDHRHGCRRSRKSRPLPSRKAPFRPAAAAVSREGNRLVSVGWFFLNPIPSSRRSLSHPLHSAETIEMTFVKDFAPRRRRSVIARSPSRRASRMEFCTRVRQTPAMAAILSRQNSHRPDR